LHEPSRCRPVPRKKTAAAAAAAAAHKGSAHESDLPQEP
jgi:hypothetical protein